LIAKKIRVSGSGKPGLETLTTTELSPPQLVASLKSQLQQRCFEILIKRFPS